MGADMTDLIQAWKDWAKDPPKHGEQNLLGCDRDMLKALRQRPGIVPWTTWDQCQREYDPWDNSGSLHLGLMPVPFAGDVRSAKVYFLLANPGLSANDYFAEFEVPAYRKRVLANLRQEFPTGYRFWPLDPMCAWHGGNAHWEKKLGKVVLRIAELLHPNPKERGGVQRVIREVLGRSVCAIELIPYHSKTASGHGGIASRLPSSQLAINYVRDVLVPRAEAQDCLLIAMRSVRNWGLDEIDRTNVIKYSGGLARGAHLSVDERLTVVSEDKKKAGTRIVDALIDEVRDSLSSG